MSPTIRTLRATLLLVATLAAAACDKVPLLAPTNTTIRLTASVSVVPTNGTANITAIVIESAGTPVQNGTVVTFSSSLGSVEPREARTSNGQVSVRYVAGAQSGTAKIGAFSGGAKSDDLEILVGAAAAGAISLRADTTVLASTGSTVEIIASVVDTGGNPLRGAPVTFSATVGTLSQATAISNDAGEARTQLTANQAGKVTAKIGAGTNAKEASLDFTVRDAPNVDISVPGVGGVSNSAEVGVPTVFTLKLASGGTYNALRNVRIDFGDGAGADLGAIALTGSTTVSHVYSRTGFFTVRVTATDVLNNVGTSTMALTVNERTTVPINLTLLSVSNKIATFQANLGTGTVSGSIRFYDWDFGDGQSASTTGNTTSHRYSSPGNYTVNVRVVTTTGSEGFATIIVTVI